MKLFSYGKDGGQESKVWGFWLIEIKSIFSIVLLRFEDGSRECYHEHAFNCFSWVLRGKLIEQFLALKSGANQEHGASWLPFITRKTTFHKVISKGRTWVLSFRGPWCDRWREHDEATGKTTTLTHGRKEVTA